MAKRDELTVPDRQALLNMLACVQKSYRGLAGYAQIEPPKEWRLRGVYVAKVLRILLEDLRIELGDTDV